MKEVWNLQGMYTGFDDPQFTGDLAEFKGIVQSAQTFAGQLKDMQPLEGLRRGIALEEKFMELAEKLVVYAMLRQAADSRDQEAGSSVGLPLRRLPLKAGLRLCRI